MAENVRRADWRYLDASRITDDRVAFDGLDVRNAVCEKLGTVEGFVVQRETNRPYYLVVDSGGWFSSRHFLLPVGHVRLDPDNEAFRVDIERDTIRGFPEVQLDQFDGLTEDEAMRFNERTLTACCPNEIAGRTGEKWDFDSWSHYRQPDWWRVAPATELPPAPLTNRPLAEDYDPTIFRNTGSMPVTPAHPAERVVAREEEDYRRPADEPLDRAQPGDVLGVETEGETTSLGDTASDEDRRRKEAEKENRETFDEQERDRRRS